MAWNGTGSYVLNPLYSPEANGQTVDAVRYNGLTSDIAAGITATLAKNGENVPTANLPMGGFKHTGAAAASTAGEYVIWGQNATLGNVTAAALTTTGNTILGDASTDTLNVGNGGLVKDASGYVGIGTASPVGRLTIKGQSNATSAQQLAFEYHGASARYLAIGLDATTGEPRIMGGSGAGISFHTNSDLSSTNERMKITSAGDVIPLVTATPPTLSTNLQMVFNLTSNTNLRISVRGSDGVTRTANITLAP